MALGGSQIGTNSKQSQQKVSTYLDFLDHLLDVGRCSDLIFVLFKSFYHFERLQDVYDVVNSSPPDA